MAGSLQAEKSEIAGRGWGRGFRGEIRDPDLRARVLQPYVPSQGKTEGEPKKQTDSLARAGRGGDR